MNLSDTMARDRLGTAARVLGALFRAEQDRWTLWIPVCMAVGIVSYFWLAVEPGWLAVGPLVLALVLAAAVCAIRAPGLLAPVLAVALVGVGAGVAKLQVSMLDTVTLPAQLGPVTLTGWVEQAQIAAKRHRLIIRVAGIERLAPEATPGRVRISLAAKYPRQTAGDAVSILVKLLPLPEPVAPGGFNFGRRLWLQGIGATGFALGPPTPADLGDQGLGARWRQAVQRVRTQVAQRVTAVIGGSPGAIATALLTGRRGGIPPGDLVAIRDSGLAHLLAISGLHMGLVSGALFWLVRALLAMVPWLALNMPIKKFASVAALVGALGYFALAGGSVATERAFIMVAVALSAIVLDRPAVSVRNIGFAAIAVMLMRPESVLSAGFQMSFGAVLALAAFFEWATTRTEPVDFEPDRPRRSWGRQLAFTLIMIAATTGIAGLATGPIAAYHFNRVVVYGLMANMVAIPLVSFVVMPVGLFALAAMPFGADAWPLAIMGAATGYLIEIAQTVASLGGAVRLVASPPPAALVLFGIGLVWICLWRRRWRWFGVAGMAAGLLVAFLATPPDILIARNGRTIAVRLSDGKLWLPLPRPSRFTASMWLRRDGDPRMPAKAKAKLAKALTCDRLACVATLAFGKKLTLVRHPAALREECARADILVAMMPVTCPGPQVVIDAKQLARTGAQSITLYADQPAKISTVAASVGVRPWSRRN
ncbi:MAG: ComEC/Rec2 family competence protein [Alphaproteobacteria bacterium]